MRLRNGKSYNYIAVDKRERKKSSIPIIDTSYDTIKGCSICYKDYKINDIVASCSDRNFYKHNYHEKCLKKYFKYNLESWNCPYCRTNIKTYIVMRR